MKTPDEKLKNFLARFEAPDQKPSVTEWAKILEAAEKERARSFFPWATLLPISAAAALALAFVFWSGPSGTPDNQIGFFIASNSQYFDEELEQPGDDYLDFISL